MPAKKSKSKKKTTARSRVATSPLKRIRQNPIAMWLTIAGLVGLGVAFVMWINAASPLSYTPAGQATSTLDESGKTLPKTNYAIPSGATFMSTTGSDSNDGKSVNTPVKSLNTAVAKTPSGGTIVMRGGEYRDWYDQGSGSVQIINKPISFQAYPGEAPWFNGTDVVSDGWTSSNGVWARSWSTPSFCGGAYYTPVNGKAPYDYRVGQDTACAHGDSISNGNYPVASDPQMAFANDAQLTEVGSLSQVTAGSKKFYYDWGNKKIYVSENPSASTIELTKRPGAFVLGGPSNFAIRGIGFHRYGSSFMGNVNASVVYIGMGGAGSGGKAEIENTVFSENAGITLSFDGPKTGTYVKNSVFAYNHYTGMSAMGFASSNPGVRNNFVIEGNIFNGNNASTADANCRASCEAAGVKMTRMAGFTVKNNIFENTKRDGNVGSGSGFWCDMNCSYGVIVNNVSRNNGGNGIFYEISSHGIIANNLIYNNRADGISVYSASTKVYNNTISTKKDVDVMAIEVVDDNRMGKEWASSGQPYPVGCDAGPNTRNVEVANNLIVADPNIGPRLYNFSNPGSSYSAGCQSPDPNTTADKYFDLLDYNIYYYNAGQILYLYGQTDAIDTLQYLRSVSGKPFENNTITVVSKGDPFADKAGSDFRLKTDSLAYTKKGVALPADVAQAIGVPAGTTPVRGAIFDSSVAVTPTPTPTLTPTPTATARPTNTVTPTPTATRPPAPTNTITPTPVPPPPPTQLGAVRKPTLGLSYDWLRGVYNIQASWSQPTGATNNISYDIIRDGTVIASTTVPNYSDYSVKPTIAYSYKIQARDAGRTSISPVATGTINCFWIFCGLWQ